MLCWCSPVAPILLDESVRRMILRYKHILITALLGAATFTAACSSAHDATGIGGAGGAGSPGGASGTSGAVDAGLTPLVVPVCVNGENAICLPSGFPFVPAALAHSDACNGGCLTGSPPGTTILFSQPVTGTLCLSGTNSTPHGTGLAIKFTVVALLGPVPDHVMVLHRFNADLLGITQVRFTIDRPPAAGLSVSAMTIHSDVCNGIDCLTLGFTLPNLITEPGTTTALLTDFVNNPPQPFDTRALDSMDFVAGPGDFDFCVRDLQFLDASGVPVTPSP